MNFFDKHPVLLPWPKILRRSGLSFTYKPREVWWKGWIEKLELKEGEKVLEVGCGRGVLLDRLVAEYGIKGFGIDISPKAIAEAKIESIEKLDLRIADACNLPFPDSSFDFVISFDTLEHISEQEKAVSEIVRVLKKGGRILIYTINSHQNFTWNRLLSKLGIDVYKNVDHKPELFVDPAWLKKKLERRGVKISGLDYFNSFFTLVADEAIMVSLLIFDKFFDWEKTQEFGRIILRLLTGFFVLTAPLLRFLDRPWTIFGYSNGFLILGEKR